MPDCGSQVYLCDLPIRFDNYKGCSHGCKYCFANTKHSIHNIERGEGVEALRRFIQGKRTLTTNWCDWNIPLHWGGVSDPFQPCEKEFRSTYECLKLLAETGYPFLVSTKGALVADGEYLSLLSRCNCVVQISAVCNKYDAIELGSPSFGARLRMIEKLASKVKRVIVRIQPYMCEVRKDVLENMRLFAEAGAYGVTIEGMKFKKKKPGLIKIGGDYTYPYKQILSDFIMLRDEGHRHGLSVYAGENRIRKYGDSLTCCGCDGLQGFKPNTYNLNHLLNGDQVTSTLKMRVVGTAECFSALDQTTQGHSQRMKNSFESEMLWYYETRKDSVDAIMGVKQ